MFKPWMKWRHWKSIRFIKRLNNTDANVAPPPNDHETTRTVHLSASTDDLFIENITHSPSFSQKAFTVFSVNYRKFPSLERIMPIQSVPICCSALYTAATRYRASAVASLIFRYYNGQQSNSEKHIARSGEWCHRWASWSVGSCCISIEMRVGLRSIFRY